VTTDTSPADTGRQEIDLFELMENQNRMSIILLLQIYDSMNLRQIATVLGISEPSTHAHLKELLERELIELDPSKAGKRGKYYRLQDSGRDDLQQAEDRMEQTYNQSNRDDQAYRKMAKGLRMIAMLSQTFGNYAAEYMEDKAVELADLYNQKGPDQHKSILTGQLSFTKVRDEQQLDQIFTAMKDFFKIIEEINTENADLDEGEIHEVIMVSNLLIPMRRLDPRT